MREICRILKWIESNQCFFIFRLYNNYSFIPSAVLWQPSLILMTRKLVQNIKFKEFRNRFLKNVTEKRNNTFRFLDTLHWHMQIWLIYDCKVIRKYLRKENSLNLRCQRYSPHYSILCYIFHAIPLPLIFWMAEIAIK